MPSQHRPSHPQVAAHSLLVSAARVAPELRDIEQFKEGLLSHPKPGQLLREFRASGLLERVIPEFAPMWGPYGQQDSKWHPEGDAFEHSCLVLDGLEEHSARLIFAAGFHDIGKPATYFKWPGNGGISNHGHEFVGANLFQEVLAPRLNLDQALTREVTSMIQLHMSMHSIDSQEQSMEALRSYIVGLPVVDDLIALQHADAMGTGRSLEERLQASKRDVARQLLRRV